MSKNLESFRCSEAQNEHALQEPRALALLQRNLDSGCQICSLLVNALRRFHGQWIADQAETLRVSRFRSISRSLTVLLHLDKCANIPERYERDAASHIRAVMTEIVFKPNGTRPVSFDYPTSGSSCCS